MKRRIISILLVAAVFCSAGMMKISAATPAVDLTSSTGWTCGGETPTGNTYSNAWGTYVFDPSGASVACSDKGYTNIMYRVTGVNFDEIKGLIFSAQALSARWDIKLRRSGIDGAVSYSGVWNGMDTDIQNGWYDFSRYSWSGTGTLDIYLYAIGGQSQFAKFTSLQLAQDTTVGAGYTINPADYSIWSAEGTPALSSGSSTNGVYDFSHNGIYMRCVQDTLFYFSMTATIKNVDFDAVKGLSYAVTTDNPGHRWDIKVSRSPYDGVSASASGGAWNGIAGPATGVVDFSNCDLTGKGNLRIELVTVHNQNGATFNDLTLVDFAGNALVTISAANAASWETSTADPQKGNYHFGGGGLTLTPSAAANSHYTLSTRKFYCDLDVISGLSYNVAAKNARFMVEVTNTTLGQTARLNPTWAGNHGPQAGYFDFSAMGWSGSANISVTVSAVSLESSAAITVRGLELLPAAPSAPTLLSAADRDEGDVTGEGDVDIFDLVTAEQARGSGQNNSYADLNANGSVGQDDLSSLKQIILNGTFFSNIDEAYALPQDTVITLQVEGYDLYERTLVTALQGLANREGPKLFLQTGLASYLNAFDMNGYGDSAYPNGFLAQYGAGGTDSFWKDEIARIYGYSFLEVPLGAALEIFESSFEDKILYDAGYLDSEENHISSPARTNAAITAAGVRNSLPVTPRLSERWEILRERETALDLTGFDDKYDATEWAINNLLSECTTELASSYFYEGENSTFQNDYAVMKGAFCYELNSVVSGNLAHSLEDPVAEYLSQDEPLLNSILSHIDDFGYVWGWGAGGENALASVTALHGLVLLCANMSNGSFFYQLPVDLPSPVQPNLTDINTVIPQNKFYIAFMMNEGDTYKAMADLYAGSWTQSARGSIPIAWGVDSLVFDLFPFFAEYYYQNATPNDYYFAAASGYGYIHPAYLPASMQSGYAARINTGGVRYGLKEIDIWWFGLSGGTNKWQWLQSTGMRGLTQWSDLNRTEFQAGIPIIHSELYYTLTANYQQGSNADKAARVANALIGARAGLGNRTYCTVIYGGEPQYFKDIADRLPSSDFEIVPLDKLYMIAEQSAPAITSATAVYQFN